MTRSLNIFATAISIVVLSAMAALPASAKCTRLAFSVNDYGKEEPARDAKRMLDKYIADWTGERSIGKYRTGPKSVNCELFLDFVVFDEYTCRAEATVCWDNEPLSSETAESEPAPKKEEKVATTPAPSKPSAPEPEAVATTPVADPTPVVSVNTDDTSSETESTVAAPAALTPPTDDTVTRAGADSDATPVAQSALADTAPTPKNVTALKGSTTGESLSNLSSSTETASKIPLVD